MTTTDPETNAERLEGRFGAAAKPRKTGCGNAPGTSIHKASDRRRSTTQPIIAPTHSICLRSALNRVDDQHEINRVCERPQRKLWCCGGDDPPSAEDQGSSVRPFRSSQKSKCQMSPINLHAGQAPRPSFSKARSAGAGATGVRPAPARMSGSAFQKQAQWLSRALDAERAGDRVEAELCRQYAEHWFRVSRGED